MKEFCKQCSKHRNERHPITPSKLASALEMIRGCVANGELLETPLNDEPYYTNFDSIRTGEWPDIIWCVFQCSTCGKTFELNAMTYAGTASNRFGEQLKEHS